MKIAICTNYFPPSIGGCEKVTKKIADYLSSRFEVTVVTRRLRGRKHVDFPYKVVEYTAGDKRSFERILNIIKPDIVLVYSDVFDFFHHLIVRENHFKLVVALCGANWTHRQRGFANVFHRNSYKVHKIICHSEHDRDFRLCSSGRFKDKTVVIPNGVDLEEFDTNQLLRQDLLPDDADKMWVLNVSNFFPGKGQMHLFKALEQIKEEELVYIQICSDIDFAIGKQLETQWIKLGSVTYPHVQKRLMKNPSREQVVGMFKQSNVFSFSSEKEVAPLVLLESMAARLPWVAMDVGNTRGLKGGKFIPAIKDRHYHSLFDNRVSKLFANSMLELMRDPAIGEEGRKQIEEEMTWDKVLPQYLSLLEHI